jgi:hypothetical protein
MEDAVYMFFNMIASSYVAGRAVRPLTPDDLVETRR